MVFSICSTGRKLLRGKFKIYLLLAADVAVLIFCVNLLPLLYENALVPFVKSYVASYERVVNFTVATVMFLIACAIRFSMTSSAGRCFYKTAGGEVVDAGDFFYFLGSDVFFENLIFRFKLSFTRFAGFIVCFLPFSLAFTFLYWISFRKTSALIITVTLIASVFFLIVGIIFYMNFSALLFLCPYIFYGGEKKCFLAIIKESQQIMIKRRSVLNKVRRSFFALFLMCVFIVPIAYVWGLFNQTKAVAARCFLGG